MPKRHEVGETHTRLAGDCDRPPTRRLKLSDPYEKKRVHSKKTHVLENFRLFHFVKQTVAAFFAVTIQGRGGSLCAGLSSACVP